VESANEAEPVNVSLINMMGQPFYEKTFQAGELIEATQVTPNEKLYKGVYIMIIKQGSTTIRERVIIKE
jgi:hypothetical protein